MAWCWVNLIISYLSPTSVLTLLVFLMFSVWLFFANTNKLVITDKHSSILINGNAQFDISNIDTLEGIRHLLLSDDYIPVSLHDKASLEPKKKLWQKEDSLYLKNFFKRTSNKKSDLRNIIAESTTFLVSYLKENNDQVINFSEVMSTHSLNILYGITFGRSFKMNDPGILEVKFEMESMVALWPKFSTSVWRHAANKSDELMDFRVVKNDFITRMKQAVMFYELDKEETRQLLIKDLIRNIGSEPNEEDKLAETLLIFFLCGYESLSGLFSSAMLLLAKNSNVQEKMYKELKEKDSENAAFTQATFQELLRIIKPVPFATRYSNSKSFSDEKSTNCVKILDLEAVLHSSEHWDYPANCQPERFLNKMGKNTNHDAFIPFSLGERSCPGQILVEIAFGILLTSIVKNFRISKSETDEDEDAQEGRSIKLLISSR